MSGVAGVARGGFDLAERARGRARVRRLWIAGFAAALAVVALGAAGTGAIDVPAVHILAILADRLLGLDLGIPYEGREEAVLMAIRLPRLVLGLCVGAALAVSGAVLQGMFRNPLADPALIGVSSGASMGAVMMIVLGGPLLTGAAAGLSAYAIPFAAFLGGLLIVTLVYGIAQRGGGTDVATLLLAGIALNALAAAVVGLMMFLSDDRELRDLNFWLLGSIASATWQKVTILLPCVAIGLVGLQRLTRFLNAIALGESEARHLGIGVEAAKRWAIVLVALATGAAVAMSGVVAFVGLTVPHLVRLMIGPDHRYLLPASALLGALVITLADTVARTAASPADLPIGVVMSLIGGPFFIWLLYRRRQAGF
ncbi:FecCD family ABC transporter permease [Minwuia thermotolerans]|uniref:Iron ABC transporter n=1 Tax=Minwuia thermotolerans TaxID=2056226 RepID=A0A2M9FVN5_9PROT|nr:iron ABC transporter permease [Minwuia thermotolerans]PJK27514.1 hypothetical protein CVT23_21595 [Minwuia thermotolerans]